MRIVIVAITGLYLINAIPFGSSVARQKLSGAPPKTGPCPAVCTDQDCPNIACLPCAECLEATGDDLTLTPDTDPLWRPIPAYQFPTANRTQFSLTCRRAIRYYLHAVAPRSNYFPCTMYRMCISILEFGPTAIRCLEDEYPIIAYTIFGQFVRCQFAKDFLGEDWGKEKAEKSIFIDSRTNRTLGGIDFIRDGFLQLNNQTSQGETKSS